MPKAALSLIKILCVRTLFEDFYVIVVTASVCTMQRTRSGQES